MVRHGEWLPALREALALFEGADGAGGVAPAERGSLSEKIGAMLLQARCLPPHT